VISDPVYWLALLALFLVTLATPLRLRIQVAGIASFIFLFYLIGSVNNTGADEFNFSTLFNENYRVIYYLLLWTLLYYFAPKISDALNVTFFSVQIVLNSSVLLFLAYNKYVPVLVGYFAGQFVSSDLIVPLGISYFSFKLIHYSIESGRGKFKPHTFSQFFTYIFLFPIYTAGPIERFDHFQNHWDSPSRSDDLIEGGTRIVYGLIKKFFISAYLLIPLLAGNTAESMIIRIDDIEIYKVWGFLLVSYLIIYMDFSAYSDIAIGSSRILGFRIMENFNWPIFSTNISMLWKRWHMTLSGWCQAYVYMPTIGLTRNPYLAIVSTFLAVGLWHGGAYSWIAWGLYQGLGVLIYVKWSQTKLKRKWKIPKNLPLTVIACLITNIWMAGSFAFTVTITDGSISDVFNAVRLLARCVGL
jgi:alginate O-acetyltransferase complex protein AlgI